jgi:hypothetical protein
MNAMVEGKMRAMEDSWNLRAAADMASVVSDPKHDEVLKENLKKFVAARVFPKFKFIFKKEILGQVVEMALTTHFITKPDGWGLADMQKAYHQVVRSCLDGCRANAQSIARKKYLGKKQKEYCMNFGMALTHFSKLSCGRGHEGQQSSTSFW